ncbi:protein-disulfide reductase DsbD family protein [Erythrobacter mangrovi]|uniref:Thioredoxin family protein n=1 Tax=Erythrobacter mangrovi TaxID=2739433 RepID=A0A7D3XA25_9SPHN|nr:thioredoxin family protein [Erythrobacter mangrovi]QKG70380.1 thioredoxin family protein [Erythrobacter mangrovi]
MNGLRAILTAVVLALAALLPIPAVAQSQPGGPNDIAIELVADGAPQPGKEWVLALHFTPRSPEWHGYWSNPGDAGLGMELDWQLPEGWRAGEPLYPLPKRLIIGELMNHVYEGSYAVLVPIAVPSGGATGNTAPIRLTASYLACTDTICVPQVAKITFDPAHARKDPRFNSWRAAIVPPLGSEAGFEFAGDRLRIGIPLPAASDLSGEPHVFLAQGDMGNYRRPIYTAAQTFIREADMLVAEISLQRIPGPSDPGVDPVPGQIEGILDFGNGRGVKFAAGPADVPLEGVKPINGGGSPALWQLLLAALVGGLLLNVMPCVFPILSLKALALAKAGGDEDAARSDALAYTAGVVLACAALGGTILLLRSVGEQVGWAFQLQNPTVVVALFLLALAITANFLGVFEVPGLAISSGKPSRGGSFATGLLAAFVATPCTGPFMALALGAALVIPPLDAALVFVALGVGLALPFLLVGFVPAIRARLPRPGEWMERFRRWMALPMGLTAVALAWLIWRIGGVNFLFIAALMGGATTLWLVLAGRMQRAGKGGPVLAALAAGVAVGLVFLPQPKSPELAAESLLDPVPFSDDALAEARASGRPVFVWFTADWCVTCKVNESVAIEREETKAAFEKAGVIAIRADWTRPDEAISRILTQQGAAGVPLYLWYAPGAEAEQLPQVLTPDLLVEKARSSR